MHEQSPGASTPPSSETVEAALPLNPFEVDQATLLASYPSLEQGIAGLGLYATMGLSQSDESPDALAKSVENMTDKGYDIPGGMMLGRSEVRKRHNLAGGLIQPAIRIAAQLIASYEDTEVGSAEVGGILNDAFINKTVDQHFLWNEGIVPVAEIILYLRHFSEHVSKEVDALPSEDMAQRYTFLKALAHDISHSRPSESLVGQGLAKDTPLEWQPAQALNALSFLAGAETPRQVAQELQQGEFDPYIAKDILEFVEGNRNLDEQLTKVRQLSVLLSTFSGSNAAEDRSAFHDRVIGALAQWPDDQRQVVLRARHGLLHSIELNKRYLSKWVRDNNFFGPGNTAADIELALRMQIADINDSYVRKNIPYLPAIDRARLFAEARRKRPKKQTPKEDPAAQQQDQTPEAPAPKKLLNLVV